MTTRNVGRLLAIVLDNEVISAPRVNEPITGGSGIISDNLPLKKRRSLRCFFGRVLPAPMSFLEERTVGPGLGADLVEAGKNASLLGLVLVIVFMVVIYGRFGLMADVALLFNIAIIFALLSVLQATLTLPGIAGIVLTMGMAVDANVLIFERIREETLAGRSPINAIEAGYKRALTTIIDSNLTTLIAAVLLFAFGSGPIKGFAVTLSIGIVTSMFTAIMVTRLLIVLLSGRARKHCRFNPGDNETIRLIRIRQYPVSRKRKLALTLSACLVVASLALFFGRGLNLGIDFLGGILLEVKTDGPADLSDLRMKVSSLGLGDIVAAGVWRMIPS